MSNPSELTNQNIFISRLGDSVDDLYATEDAFTLMSIEVEAIDYRNGTKEVFGLLDKHIKRALVNQKDCYSFWNNTFYILTYLDNKEVIETFINSLALAIEARYGKAFFLKVGYIQYPYDVVDIQNIFEDLKEKIINITPEKSNFKAGLITDSDYNNVVGEELIRYLKLLKHYGDVLYNHSLFVAKVSVGIAKALNLSNQLIKKIVVAAILHDVGYLCIPQRILVDPMHHNVKTLALVSEDELPMESQIISIADTYDLIRQQKDIDNFEIANFFISKAGIRWNEKLITIFSAILMDEKQLDTILSHNTNSLEDFFNWI